MRLSLLALLVVILSASLSAADFVWLEGEAPTKATHEGKKTSQTQKQLLSGETWLVQSIGEGEVDKAVGDEGIVMSYAFTLDQAGDWQVWNRIGFEFVRSPFSWRVDQGEWAEIKPDQLTTDLMELDYWCEAAWLQLGQAKLGAGAHTLEIRLAKRKIKNDKGEEKWDRILYASDALCIAKDFHPNGPHQPDSRWQSEQDLAAAKQVFALPEVGKGDGARSSLALDGLWEICRNDEDLPPADIAVPMTDVPKAPIWKSIKVPGDKNNDPSLTFAHRVWYRARVNVPASAAGRSLFVEFPQNNLNTTVLVNGVVCGFEKNPYCRFQIDITPGIKPGQVNELWVGIRDAWYGYTNNPKDPMRLRRVFNLPLGMTGQGFQRMAYPMWTHMSSGILQTPTLVMAGGAYVSDLFCKPSVARKQLDCDVTVKNPSDKPLQGEILCEAVDDQTGKVAKAFAVKPFTLAAKAETLVALGEPWADPVLWWPDQPQMYRLRATVKLGGKAIDLSETSFGFREWTSEGIDFKLNGITWPVWADTSGGDTKEHFLENYRRNHLRTFRFWGTSFLGMEPGKALDFLDRSGVVVRRQGILDGEGIGYMAIEEDPELKKESPIKMDLLRNWRDQEVAAVKGERNHPSVMVWSIENEWLYINCINLYGGLMDQFEAETAKTSEAVRAVDPTRFTMVDGGGACKANTMPVHGDHYVFDSGAPGAYPALAYTSNTKGGGRGRWEWDMKRPRFLGEDYFATGINPFDYAAFGGEECFQGKAATRRTVGMLMRMLTEGYRWAGFGGFHFWLAGETAEQYNSFAEVALFCRQWDWTFGANDQVKRTLRLFNNSRFDEPITATWTFTVGGKKLAGETKDYALKAGTSQEFEIVLPCPDVSDRTEGELTFALTQRGAEVFKDVKAVSVLGESKVERPALAKLAAKDLLVLDPQGGAIAALNALRIPFTRIDSLAALADSARVLLIGKDALDAAHAATPELQAWAAPGRVVVVLEQQTPLTYQGLPADLEPQQNAGCIAFIEDTAHPAMKGLQQKDFFTWGPDEIVFRGAYVKATRGAKSIVQCHVRLADSALSEMPVGQGLLAVCQLVVAEKAATIAPARRLLLNLLDYAAGYKLEYRQVAGCVGDNALLKRELDAIELTYTPVADPLKALGANQLAVITATPANLKALAGAADQVAKWTAAGGWIVFNGLTPEGLADYDKLVGVSHLIRPFRMERVTFPAARDPLTAGLTTGDIVMQSSKRINNWTADVYLAGDEFSYIVDYDDVAPFAQFPEASRFGYGESGNDHNPLNMVNGFFSSDGWQYIFSIPLKPGLPHDFDLTWPVEQELSEIEWAGNAYYRPITRLALTMDHDAQRSLTLDTQPNNEPQQFVLKPHLKGRTLTVDLAAWQENEKGAVIGVDNIRLKAARPPEFYRDVKPLLNIGAMMAYPKGKGGILLCNILLLEKEEVEANQRKKRAILSTLLRNLKAPFAGGKTIIAGAGGMKYAPVDITKFATAYRDEKGWFGDKARTFRDLPTGEQRLAGVTYQIYDFPTSPVPTVVMLGGKGIPNDPPEEVKGIPVGKKADALFFLHTARMDARMNDQERKEKKRYEMLRYVVTYADGQTVDIPVYAEIDIDDYHQKAPRPLPGAQIAWTRKLDNLDEYAVAYTKQWNNPRAEVEIKSIDVRYGEHKRGVPALIAITAATAP